MKINEVILSELFKPGKKWQWSFTGSEEAVAVFHVGEVPYQFHAYTYPDENGVWEVEFKNAERGRGRTAKFGLTGTGNSAEVMSTVADIMREFLQRYQGKVTALTFTADEQSRQALYARMAKRLLPSWTLSQTDKQFVLTAPAELDEVTNPDIHNNQFKHEQEIGDFLYKAEADNTSGYGTQLIIKVYDGRKEIATTEFMMDEDHNSLVSANTWVLPKYQELGIATTMYAYAKMLGNDVVPSRIQTDQGNRMWRSWNQAKQSKHILPRGHKGYNELNEYKEKFQGLTFEIIDNDDGQLTVKAFDQTGKELAYVEFDIGDDDTLDPQDLRVDSRYRGQGIAKIMYDYIKMHGYQIHRSYDQTDAGAAFWDKHRGNVRVWEDDSIN